MQAPDLHSMAAASRGAQGLIDGRPNARAMSQTVDGLRHGSCGIPIDGALYRSLNTSEIMKPAAGHYGARWLRVGEVRPGRKLWHSLRR